MLTLQYANIGGSHLPHLCFDSRNFLQFLGLGSPPTLDPSLYAMCSSKWAASLLEQKNLSDQARDTAFPYMLSGSGLVFWAFRCYQRDQSWRHDTRGLIVYLDLIACLCGRLVLFH
ncbi:hypothetical protein SISNIDRAFT_461524 [Sistotremastrum niveocremeum HHB9708]|uniref:Uncharacterized protein n=1 Tax=Sistotremastrum niveocremeum HHB9708 TaxID=1314777 RepID=A0A164MJQ6_9AGAM|nr:hypothetical protein SISNIDRAFT_461524 [Sistotremastrum niveocremeum HHB9708]